MQNRLLKTAAKNLIIMILGCALVAFSIEAFVIPYDIIMGGGTGIGIALYNMFHFNTALFVLIFNILMLVLSLFCLGKQFFLSTIVCSIVYPGFLELFSRCDFFATWTDNALEASLVGGALMGIGLGLIMGVGSSTGGTDVLDILISRIFHISVGVSVYIVDFTIMGAQVIYSKDIANLIYGVIVLVVEAFVLDWTLVAGKTQFQLMVFSKKQQEIRQELLYRLEAGVTMLNIETGYEEHETQGILCVIPKRKLYSAKQIIAQIDPSAFITLTQIKEVQGEGFTFSSDSPHR